VRVKAAKATRLPPLQRVIKIKASAYTAPRDTGMPIRQRRNNDNNQVFIKYEIMASIREYFVRTYKTICILLSAICIQGVKMW
jgi:hypothetical protein